MLISSPIESGIHYPVMPGMTGTLQPVSVSTATKMINFFISTSLEVGARSEPLPKKTRLNGRGCVSSLRCGSYSLCTSCIAASRDATVSVSTFVTAFM
jgi:hypothetical protein